MDSLVPPSIYKNPKHYKLQRQHIDSIWEKIIEKKINIFLVVSKNIVTLHPM